jgi:hypothetical protein
MIRILRRVRSGRRGREGGIAEELPLAAAAGPFVLQRKLKPGAYKNGLVPSRRTRSIWPMCVEVGFTTPGTAAGMYCIR